MKKKGGGRNGSGGVLEKETALHQKLTKRNPTREVAKNPPLKRKGNKLSGGLRGLHGEKPEKE